MMTTLANNKVFLTEHLGITLVIVPQGDAGGFRYNDVHRETNALQDFIQKSGIKNILFDFSQVEIIGSIMISSIIKLARRSGDLNGQACFCQASEPMREVMQSMNLTKLWPCFESRDAAFEFLSRS